MKLSTCAGGFCGSGRKSRPSSAPGSVRRSAEALLQRMQDKVDGLCTERDRLVRESRLTAEGRRTYAGTGKVIIGTPAARRV
jgi:hypothetical protein